MSLFSASGATILPRSFADRNTDGLLAISAFTNDFDAAFGLA